MEGNVDVTQITAITASGGASIPGRIGVKSGEL